MWLAWNLRARHAGLAFALLVEYMCPRRNGLQFTVPVCGKCDGPLGNVSVCYVQFWAAVILSVADAVLSAFAPLAVHGHAPLLFVDISPHVGYVRVRLVDGAVQWELRQFVARLISRPTAKFLKDPCRSKGCSMSEIVITSVASMYNYSRLSYYWQTCNGLL